MTQYNNLKEANLNILGIRDLRKLAFSIGVYGYTKYNKSELIEHIKAVIYGKEPPKTESTKGRPTSITKSRKEVFIDILSKLQKNDSFSFQPQYLVASSSSYYDSGRTQTINVEGFFYSNSNSIIGEDNGVWSNICFVPDEIIKRHKIISGTHILGKASLNQNGFYVLTEVVPTEQPSYKYDSQKSSILKEQLILKGKDLSAINVFAPMAKGGKTIIIGNSRILSSAKDIVISALNAPTTILLETENFINENKKYTRFFIDIDDKNCPTLTHLAFDYAKCIANKNSVIIVDSLNQLIKSYCENAVQELVATQKANISEIKKLFLSAGAKPDGASLSLIAFAENNSEYDNIVIESLKSIFDTVIILSEELYLDNIKLPIDPQFSFTKRQETFQTEEFYQNAQNLRKLLIQNKITKKDAINMSNDQYSLFQ